MQRFTLLLEGFVSGTLAEEELQEFLHLLERHESLVEQRIMEDLEQNTFAGLTSEEQRGRMFAQIRIQKEQLSEPAVVRFMRPWKWVVAASIIVVLGLASYFLLFQRKEDRGMAKTTTPAGTDIAPGHDGAILTLADGRQMVLDSVKGSIATEGGVVVMNKEGSVQYNSRGIQNPKLKPVYNTISTPKGRQYQLVLDDGSKVWLNAGSSIRFPTVFHDKDRRVEITGEAYFEVAHDATKPFHVQKGETDITVLGTHFNVNAYEDEQALKVTLLQGSVKVSLAHGQPSTVIKPGEQAVADPTLHSLLTTRPDLGEVMAWKNGIFQFTNSSIESIMKQVSRWYDVEVVYQGSIKQTFNGKIPRTVGASELFKILESTGWVHFKIEGKKVIVQP